jgi:hypothetical protein
VLVLVVGLVLNVVQSHRRRHPDPVPVQEEDPAGAASPTAPSSTAPSPTAPRPTAPSPTACGPAS